MISLTDTDCNMICCIWMYGDKIGSHHGNIMMVDGKNKGGIDGCIDQSKQIFLALKSAIS